MTNATAFGRFTRDMREGDCVGVYDADGKKIGHVELARVPDDLKVKVAFCFDRTIKIRHEKLP